MTWISVGRPPIYELLFLGHQLLVFVPFKANSRLPCLENWAFSGCGLLSLDISGSIKVLFFLKLT
jgi:hypothetical protein